MDFFFNYYSDLNVWMLTVLYLTSVHICFSIVIIGKMFMEKRYFMWLSASNSQFSHMYYLEVLLKSLYLE